MKSSPGADPSRTIPSDALPADVGAMASHARLARLWKGATAKLPANGPRHKALVAFLKQFVGTPLERAIFEAYFDYSRPDARDVSGIEREAALCKMTPAEWAAEQTLAHLRKLARRKGMALLDPGPDADKSATPANGKTARRTEAPQANTTPPIEKNRIQAALRLSRRDWPGWLSGHVSALSCAGNKGVIAAKKIKVDLLSPCLSGTERAALQDLVFHRSKVGIA